MAFQLMPSIVAALPSFVGGIVGAAGSRKERIAAENQTRKLRAEDREWFEADRRKEQRYAAGLTSKDRAYAEQMRDDEREYARSVLVDDRRYDRNNIADQRQYDEGRLKDDRQYAQTQLERQYRRDDKMYEQDVRQYETDRDFMQKRSNKIAESAAASRGIDFVKLRDDAVKAGYNPMTALSMAHAYSTHVDYQTQGGVYSPRANYQTDRAAYSPMSGPSAGGGSGGGSGGAAPGAVMGSAMPAAGNFQTAGGGYQRDSQPALAAGSFVADALQRGLDQWTNKPVANDPLADALRNAFEQDQMAEQVRDAQIPGDFGYALTKQQAFQPEATIGVPSFAKAAPTKAKMPSGFVEKGGRKYVPVTLPDGSQSSLEASVARRYDIMPFDVLSAGDWEEIRGGVVGEMENTINADQNYDLMTGGNFWPVPPSAGDYAKSGRTGHQMFSSWPSN